MSQNEMVLKHLNKYGCITTFQAFDLYGITRLSARIKDIRNMGYEIIACRQKATNRYGKKIGFCRYTLMNFKK